MSLSPAAILYSTAGTAIATGTTDPASNALAIVTRNIPSGTQDVNITNASIAVTGSLTVSTIDTVTSITNPVAVTGTFWQATQPVSGIFWQATQPVSIAASVAVTGPLTDTELRATPVPVSGSFYQATQPVSIAASVAVTGPLTDTELRATPVPVSGSITANLGTIADVATQTTLSALNTKIPANLTVASTRLLVDGSGVTQPVSGTFWQATQPVSGTFWQATQPVSIAASVAVTGPLTDTQLRATPVPISGTVTITDGAGALNTIIDSGTLTGITNSVAVTGTFWQATQPVSLAAAVSTVAPKNSTATLSNVASSATNVTLLASNASRCGATIFNDSTQVLYVKFGATASSSSFTIKMAADSYYEVPFGYTGIIDGIWASANGNARVTEVT